MARKDQKDDRRPTVFMAVVEGVVTLTSSNVPNLRIVVLNTEREEDNDNPPTLSDFDCDLESDYRVRSRIACSEEVIAAWENEDEGEE